MRHSSLSRDLELLLILSDARDYSVEDICDKLDISRRTLYYYIESFRRIGFNIFKRNGCYHVDQRSPFLRKLLDLLQFSEDEAVLIRRLLDKTNETNAVVRSIRYKLDRFYDFNILNDVESRERVSRIVNALYEAIKQKRLVKIVGYSSPHSRSVSDRVVEPFLFMNNNNDIRCYELSSNSCKTFRLSRMQDAVMVDLTWSNEEKHRQAYTDIFMFSGEEQLPVTVRLGRLAHNVFVEEHPQGEQFMQQEDESHWLLKMSVCDYRGIGRFVLGLYEDVEVLGDDGFLRYLQEKISKMKV